MVIDIVFCSILCYCIHYHDIYRANTTVKGSIYRQEKVYAFYLFLDDVIRAVAILPELCAPN